MGTTGQSKDDDLIILSDDIATDEDTFGEDILDEAALSDDKNKDKSDILTFDTDISVSNDSESLDLDSTEDNTIIDLDDTDSLESDTNESDTKSDDSKIDFDFGDLSTDDIDSKEEAITEGEDIDSTLGDSKSEEVIDLGVDLKESSEITEATESDSNETDFSLGGGAILTDDTSSDLGSMTSILDDTISKLSSRKSILEEKKSSEESHMSELKEQVTDLENQILESEIKVEDFNSESKHIESNVSQLESMKEAPSDSGKKEKK